MSMDRDFGAVGSVKRGTGGYRSGTPSMAPATRCGGPAARLGLPVCPRDRAGMAEARASAASGARMRRAGRRPSGSVGVRRQVSQPFLNL